MSNGHANLIVFGLLALAGVVIYVRAVLHEQDEHDARKLANDRRRDRIEAVRRNRIAGHEDWPAS